MSKGILYDATMCIGCKQCESACAQQNELPTMTGSAESVQTDHKFTTVLAKDDKSCAGYASMRASSLRLGLPGRSLPQDAMARGVRRLEVHRMPLLHVACAFAAQVEWATDPRVRKCIMCPDRVAQGLATACATACPTGATKFGDHEH